MASINLSKLDKVTSIHDTFLEDCPLLTTIDFLPPGMVDRPPKFYKKREEDSGWVRVIKTEEDEEG